MELRDLILKNEENGALDLLQCEEKLIDLLENKPNDEDAFSELKDLTFRENQERQKAFLAQYEKKLIELLSECGLYDTDVFLENTRGRLKIENSRYAKEIHFCPYKKDGTLSKVSRSVPALYGFLRFYSDEQIKNKLKENFTPATKIEFEEDYEEARE